MEESAPCKGVKEGLKELRTTKSRKSMGEKDEGSGECALKVGVLALKGARRERPVVKTRGDRSKLGDHSVRNGFLRTGVLTLQKRRIVPSGARAMTLMRRLSLENSRTLSSSYFIFSPCRPIVK